MKKIFTIIIILAVMVGKGYTQEKVRIGEVADGKLKITNETALKSYLHSILKNSGSLVGDIKTEASPDGTRYCAIMKVTGHEEGISSAGVMLVIIKNEAFIMASPEGDSSPIGPGAGGSATFTCIGVGCDMCWPEVSWSSGGWLPKVRCNCISGSGSCNSSVSFTVGISAGF